MIASHLIALPAKCFEAVIRFQFQDHSIFRDIFNTFATTRHICVTLLIIHIYVVQVDMLLQIINYC